MVFSPCIRRVYFFTSFQSESWNEFILAASLQNKIALEMYSICFKILGMKIIFDLLDYY